MLANQNYQPLLPIVINIIIAKIMKENLIEKTWEKISPTWPLKNVIACNPLQGFENLQFEEALKQSPGLFQNQQLPLQLEKINQLSIKWCQVFFDAGQATIAMPNRDQGFYKSWKDLAIFDQDLHQKLPEKIELLKNLPNNSLESITQILEKINLDNDTEEAFLTLLLTTLSGWSSYVKYLGDWSYSKDAQIKNDYLAIRLIISFLIWPDAAKQMAELLKPSFGISEKIAEISTNENAHKKELIKSVYQNLSVLNKTQKTADAQLVFCIDVRSEPMRKAIESCGNYETFGFAGFFGIPTAITNSLTGEYYASCPVLLAPKHNVLEKPICSSGHQAKQIKGYSTICEIKKFYQSLKYNFTTPLPLAEGMGIWSGAWMLIKTFSPKTRKMLQATISKGFKQNLDQSPEIESIPFSDQRAYALGFLKAIGLTKNFAKLVVLCGHGSQTENNTYATALDCGACGGRHGDSNAKILAKILNQKELRIHLEKSGISIPDQTKFIAAKHNTTNDEIEIYVEDEISCDELENLKKDLLKAKKINNQARAKEMGFDNQSKLEKFFFKKTHNWSETRPEWGLARNASLIVAPRSLTKNIDLKGRSFLHSYDWQIDEDGAILNLILNAPMVVAQWINSQYLFSTIDNVAFGSGSKITQNIVGKIGVMQGNGSDLMNGLPLQSVYKNDQQNYHLPARLSGLIYAPSDKIDQIISNSPKLQQLISNKWIFLYCLDPRSSKIYQLESDNIWKIL